MQRHECERPARFTPCRYAHGRMKLFRAATILCVAMALVFEGTAYGAITPTVTMTNYQYSPTPVTISLGQTVTWQNNAAATTHTATSDGVSDGEGTTGVGLWDSGNVI